MNTKKIFLSLLLISAEALIIICFLHFGKNISAKLLTLNIAIASIINLLIFIDFYFPTVNFKDKSHNTIGSLGVRSIVTLLYIGAAVATIVVFFIRPVNADTQIIIHGIFLFLFCLGLYFAVSSSHKVNEVFLEQQQTRSRIEEMKKATKTAKSDLEKKENIPVEIIARIVSLQENLRYISPCDNKEAFALESDFLIQMKVIQDCLFETPLNPDRIIESIQNCERTCKERKQLFSN